MTSVAPLVYYPQYCFHLSPTINKWCPLRASDIANLECRPGFEDVDVFFSLNHPIRWVRIVGIVVAVDDYYGRRVYTVDDSTGQCIECTLAIPKPARSDKLDLHEDKHGNAATRLPHSAKGTSGDTTTKDLNNSTNPTTPQPPPSEVDVGTVLEVKGSIKLFRGQKQIQILKMVNIQSTTQEVLFWDKIRDFRRDVLGEPWVLREREVRKCKKLQQTEAASAEEEKKKKERRARRKLAAQEEGLGKTERKAETTHRRATDSLGSASATAMRGQRAARVEKLRELVGGENQYSALGL